ncbi:FAD-linked oxidase C-terminal domain-containing protein [Azospirillum picis]|uniref:D-lactate dehydrogenase (cytochrome) n=1 Tax=Azospirillum picis TaxID=488438 RepID=A0ABU0MFD6_9PROT|nr:FAD-linked oxidase C-terminal domain-containing protein [Azospirillum picis]MBP2298123.1 D-lactate dehydrogenase (cytochrome) [Azospirillum picis]MDQ0531961.1 D-lactate dehydrogenase (cytochrome) [Azospirillum picis]
MTVIATTRPRAALTEEARAELAALLGDRFTTSLPVREHHGKDESYHAPFPPDGVAFASSTEEVSAIVRICAKHKLPIIPFGTGTSLEGGIAALAGGITIDLSNMQQILRVSAEDLDVTVQAGVTRKQLNEHLRDTGLFFPIDPGANASLGGMTATRASGTNAVRYGTMRENVLGLTVVLADGRVIRTGGRARKSAAGYDLTRLFVGSEGTLGIITEVTLKLYGIPEAISSAVCAFSTIKGAVDTVIQTIQVGVPVARIELLDEVQIDAVNKYSKLDYAVAPTLFFEFHGTEAGVKEQAEMVAAIASEHGGMEFAWAVRPEDRSKLWQARHDAYYAALALRPGSKGWPTDVCVPISRLADCILETKQDLAESNMLAPMVGHVGDGNFHLVYVIDPEKPEEMAEAQRLADKMVGRALAMGGTCTGEHGIGYGKMAFLEQETGDAYAVMGDLKRTLDPDNLLNPGKVVRV